MSFVVTGILSIALCWKWGNWRNWKEYYPTILYFAIGNLVYMALTEAHPLWDIGKPWGRNPVLEVSVMVLLYPTTTILYLSHYPENASLFKQAGYLALWVGAYSAMEAVGCLTQSIHYHEPWNLWYSIGFNCLMFPLLRLHFKKPLVVWPISAALAFLLLFWFSIPFSH